MTTLSLVLVGLAAALLSGPATVSARVPGATVSRGLVVAAGGVVVTVLLAQHGAGLVLTILTCGFGAGAWSLVARARGRREADLRQAKVVDSCEALVGELRAGLPPLASLDHCLEGWSDLEPVVAAARLGADVPAALRRLAERPGCAGLREVADAWQVSERSGSALSLALGQVARSVRADQATRHVVRAELASARATAQTVAALPVVALAMAAGVGADPWHFLLRTPAGLTCLAAGCGLALLGLHWIDRLSAAVLET